MSSSPCLLLSAFDAWAAVGALDTERRAEGDPTGPRSSVSPGLVQHSLTTREILILPVVADLASRDTAPEQGARTVNGSPSRRARRAVHVDEIDLRLMTEQAHGDWAGGPAARRLQPGASTRGSEVLRVGSVTSGRTIWWDTSASCSSGSRWRTHVIACPCWRAVRFDARPHHLSRSPAHGVGPTKLIWTWLLNHHVGSSRRRVECRAVRARWGVGTGSAAPTAVFGRAFRGFGAASRWRRQGTCHAASVSDTSGVLPG